MLPTTSRRIGKVPVFAVVMLTLLAFAAPTPATASSHTTTDLPVRFSADEMQYDQELGIVTATGSVEVIQENRILKADKITYNEKTDALSATGNIILLEPSGEVIFGNYMELSGDLRDGIVEDIRIILTDGARIAANGGRRSAGNIIEMSKAVYSPCNLCSENPTRAPLWQIKAVKIVHDKNRRMIEYSDAWMEVAGIPVFYTPYFAHPDPTVKRKSGLLTPSIGTSTDLGVVMKAPYYLVTSPSSDVTITPWFTTDEGPVLETEYRQTFRKGTVKAQGSLTRDSDDVIRGHFLGEARFQINDTWRWGLDAERASDDTYMRRYGIPGTSTLTSRAFVEGFRDRNYLSFDAYSFQSLVDGVNDTPLLAPMFQYSHVGQPDRFGGRSNLDLSLLALTQFPGTDTRRFTVDAGWLVPYVGPMGDVWRFSTSLRGDLYHIDNFNRTGGKDRFGGFTGRIIPRASLEWRYPMIRTDGRFHQILEPIGSIVVSPYGGNPDTIPNEDSLQPELDDTNLFKENRFSGFDRVDGGPRVNYGLKWGVFGSKAGSTSIMFGQSYRLKADDTFADGSGIEDNLSDIVGIVRVKPGKFIDLIYRTRLDKDNLKIRRNEIDFTAGTPALSFSTDYVFFDRQVGSEFPGREEVTFSISSRINRYWNASARTVRDLAADSIRTAGFNLTYEDECLIFAAAFTRSFFEDRDLKQSDSLTFRVTFKTLGEVGTGL